MSKILKTAEAGTLESNDIMIIVAPGDGKNGISIELQSSVLTQYGDSIRQTIATEIEKQGVTDILVKAIDRGALDFTIRARTLAALARAGLSVKEAIL